MKILNSPLVLGALLLIGWLVSQAFFTVHEREKALRVRFGKIVQSEYEPGLHYRASILDNVYRFDKRILTTDVAPERLLTKESKNVIVDFFVKWRIVDARAFFTTMQGRESAADQRLTRLGLAEVLKAIRKRTIREVVSSARSTLMDEIKEGLANEAESFGIEIVDVRIKQVELPEDVRDSVYQRMEKDRAKIASEFRSEGDEEAKKIRATADRIRVETLAAAYAEAENTRGVGDAESAKTYAEAYEQDPEFYSLHRSLSAYRSAFSGSSDVMLLNPESEFFRYFNSPTSKPAAK
ncbi:MAG: protease modulator HflC [Granulosicoccaceae bacterium]